MTLELFGALAAIGLVAGVLAGLLGVGGGVVLVPALVLMLGFDQHVAQGTSLVVIVPAALAGSTVNYRRGRFRLLDAALLVAGGLAGAAIGSSLALGLQDASLRRLFAVLLVAFGVQQLLPRGWLSHRLRELRGG
jgi:uncharacterized membrane protein YfcA